jgi:hypothetical protein
MRSNAGRSSRRFHRGNDNNTRAAARSSWFDKLPVLFSGLSILFSLFALIVSGLTLYYTFFRHVPDLVVYLRFPQPKQLGTNFLDVNYFFSNMGNQTVFIEDVAIDELWVKSDRPGAMGTFHGEHGQIE